MWESSTTRANKRRLGSLYKEPCLVAEFPHLLRSPNPSRSITPPIKILHLLPRHEEAEWGVGPHLLALPLQNNTIPSGVCSPSQGLDQQFLFHFIFASLKLFCFPKAMHTPVSQEAGSKLPGLPFRALAVVNNTSPLSPFT